MKNINPLGLFDEHFLLERMTKLKDPLVKLEEHIDRNIFSPILDVVFHKPKNSNRTGRSPFNRIMMFKILILQSLYNLSDDQMEYQITDRCSFMRFFCLKVSDKVPDAKTIWNFSETLIQEKIIDALFYRFNQALDDQSVFAKMGQIVDASIVEVSRQRNTREENKQIKQGEIHESWQKQPNKLRQKGRGARWLKKNKQNFYGYKNHIKVDQGKKLVSGYAVSDAAIHDSQELETLIDKDNAGQKLYGDSAYTGQDENVRWCDMQSEINEKGISKGKLTDKQDASNRRKSKARARVEHVFLGI